MLPIALHTAQKNEDFHSGWSHLLKKSVMETFIFFAVARKIGMQES